MLLHNSSLPALLGSDVLILSITCKAMVHNLSEYISNSFTFWYGNYLILQKFKYLFSTVIQGTMSPISGITPRNCL